MTGTGQNAWRRVSWNITGSLFISDHCLLPDKLSREEKGLAGLTAANRMLALCWKPPHAPTHTQWL